MDKLDKEVDQLIADWKSMIVAEGNITFLIVCKFILNCIDLLINVAMTFAISGTEKKGQVITAISRIYDAIVSPMIPLWLKPVQGLIKGFLLNNVISMAIDFFVAKYKDGSWNTVATDQEKK